MLVDAGPSGSLLAARAVCQKIAFDQLQNSRCACVGVEPEPEMVNEREIPTVIGRALHGWIVSQGKESAGGYELRVDL
jgi:hypothetical protein